MLSSLNWCTVADNSISSSLQEMMFREVWRMSLSTVQSLAISLILIDSHTASSSVSEYSFHCMSTPLCVSCALFSSPFSCSAIAGIKLSPLVFYSSSSVLYPHFLPQFSYFIFPLCFSLCHFVCWFRGMQYEASCGSLAVDTCDSAPRWVTSQALWEGLSMNKCVFCMSSLYIVSYLYVMYVHV